MWKRSTTFLCRVAAFNRQSSTTEGNSNQKKKNSASSSSSPPSPPSSGGSTGRKNASPSESTTGNLSEKVFVQDQREGRDASAELGSALRLRKLALRACQPSVLSPSQLHSVIQFFHALGLLTPVSFSAASEGEANLLDHDDENDSRRLLHTNNVNLLCNENFLKMVERQLLRHAHYHSSGVAYREGVSNRNNHSGEMDKRNSIELHQLCNIFHILTVSAERQYRKEKNYRGNQNRVHQQPHRRGAKDTTEERTKRLTMGSSLEKILHSLQTALLAQVELLTPREVLLLLDTFLRLRRIPFYVPNRRNNNNNNNNSNEKSFVLDGKYVLLNPTLHEEVKTRALALVTVLERNEDYIQLVKVLTVDCTSRLETTASREDVPAEEEEEAEEETKGASMSGHDYRLEAPPLTRNLHDSTELKNTFMHHFFPSSDEPSLFDDENDGDDGWEGGGGGGGVNNLEYSHQLFLEELQDRLFIVLDSKLEAELHDAAYASLSSSHHGHYFTVQEKIKLIDAMTVPTTTLAATVASPRVRSNTALLPLGGRYLPEKMRPLLKKVMRSLYLNIPLHGSSASQHERPSHTTAGKATGSLLSKVKGRSGSSSGLSDAPQVSFSSSPAVAPPSKYTVTLVGGLAILRRLLQLNLCTVNFGVTVPQSRPSPSPSSDTLFETVINFLFDQVFPHHINTAPNNHNYKPKGISAGLRKTLSLAQLSSTCATLGLFLAGEVVGVQPGGSSFPDPLFDRMLLLYIKFFQLLCEKTLPQGVLYSNTNDNSNNNNNNNNNDLRFRKARQHIFPLLVNIPYSYFDGFIHRRVTFSTTAFVSDRNKKALVVFLSGVKGACELLLLGQQQQQQRSSSMVTDGVSASYYYEQLSSRERVALVSTMMNWKLCFINSNLTGTERYPLKDEFYSTKGGRGSGSTSSSNHNSTAKDVMPLWLANYVCFQYNKKSNPNNNNHNHNNNNKDGKRAEEKEEGEEKSESEMVFKDYREINNSEQKSILLCELIKRNIPPNLSKGDRDGDGRRHSNYNTDEKDYFNAMDMIQLINEITLHIYPLHNPNHVSRRARVNRGGGPATKGGDDMYYHIFASLCATLHEAIQIRGLSEIRRTTRILSNYQRTSTTSNSLPPPTAPVNMSFLLRYLNSMSKLGIHTKQSYYAVMDVMHFHSDMEQISFFDLTSVLQVLAREHLHSPVVLRLAVRRLQWYSQQTTTPTSLQGGKEKTLTPRQKVLYLKYIAQAPGGVGQCYSPLHKELQVAPPPAVDEAADTTVKRQRTWFQSPEEIYALYVLEAFFLFTAMVELRQFQLLRDLYKEERKVETETETKKTDDDKYNLYHCLFLEKDKSPLYASVVPDPNRERGGGGGSKCLSEETVRQLHGIQSTTSLFEVIISLIRVLPSPPAEGSVRGKESHKEVHSSSLEAVCQVWLESIAEYLIQQYTPHSRHGGTSHHTGGFMKKSLFIDMGKWTTHWNVMQYYLEHFPHPHRETSAFSRLLEVLHDHVMARLRHIAASPFLSPNTFLYGQLAAGIELDVLPSQFNTSPSDGDGDRAGVLFPSFSPKHLSKEQIAKLVSNLETHRLQQMTGNTDQLMAVLQVALWLAESKQKEWQETATRLLRFLALQAKSLRAQHSLTMWALCVRHLHQRSIASEELEESTAGVVTVVRELLVKMRAVVLKETNRNKLSPLETAVMEDLLSREKEGSFS